MSFGGTVLSMILSLKNNSNLLAKRKTYKELSKNYKYKPGDPLKYKELPEAELIVLKAKIKRDLTRQRRLFALKSLFLIVLILGTGGVILSYVNNNYIEKSKKNEKELRSILESRKYSLSDIDERGIEYYLNQGNYLLSNNQYVGAKYYFKKAYKYGPNDFFVLYANAKVYIYDCIYNDVECAEAIILLEYLEQHFGTNQDVKDLIKIYNEKN
ncbi:MAG: hypothetical protein K9H49_15590 [Bacteroidales bacterium]|nr:hypothetical protein [Bacteroidales bacterium]MCF8405490.1 hypothetical protein [Bacteroidales bacterium]